MTVILDASAVMAMLLDERGGDAVRGVTSGADISIVNLAEVMSSIRDRGLKDGDVPKLLARLDVRVRSFDEAHAFEVARLRPLTKHLGLGFGDRTCLAQGLLSGRPVLTGDRAWRQLDLGVEVRLFR